MTATPPADAVPKVTVLIPAYNAAGTIEAAVASALSQDEVDLEVVVVDDGSDDDTLAIVLSLARGDARVRVIGQAHAGVSVARNHGLDRATGLWIALLDADDTWLPHRLSRMLAVAALRVADLVADNLIVVERGRRRLAFPVKRMADLRPVEAIDFIDDDRPRHGLYSSGFIKPIMRRAFLERHGLRYVDGQQMSEDFELYLTALLAGARMHYMAEACYVYTMQSVSLSQGDSKTIVSSIRPVHDRLVERARIAGRSDVVDALEQRNRDIDVWLQTVEFERSLDTFRPWKSARLFLALPSRRIGIYRIFGKLRYDALVALGRRPVPRIGRRRKRNVVLNGSPARRGSDRTDPSTKAT